MVVHVQVFFVCVNVWFHFSWILYKSGTFELHVTFYCQMLFFIAEMTCFCSYSLAVCLITQTDFLCVESRINATWSS